MGFDKAKIIFATGGVGKRIPTDTSTVIKHKDNEILFINLSEETEIKISDKNKGDNENE